MAEKSPAFQFYPKDFLSDSTAILMPAEARGIYITLLCHDWINDGVPAHHGNLMALGGFSNVEYCNSQLRDPEVFEYLLNFILPAFIPHPTKPETLTNPRLLRERERQQANRIEKQKAGKKGGLAKAKNKASKPLAKRSSSSSSSSSTSLKPQTFWSEGESIESLFERIWEFYPEKKGKVAAFKKFKAQVKSEKDWQDINLALMNYQADVKQIRDNGHPDRAWQNGSTWFNGNWKDYVDYKPPPKARKIVGGLPLPTEEDDYEGQLPEGF